MSDNGKQAIPFPAAVPIVGMPCTIRAVWIPVHGILTCNCGAGVEIVIAGEPETCQACKRVYSLSFNPSTGKIDVKIGVPKEPS